MNLPVPILESSLFILTACIVVFFIRYTLNWRTDANNILIRLKKIEEELHHRPNTCPLKLQIDAINRTVPITKEEKPNSLDLIRNYTQIHCPTFISELNTIAADKLTSSDELLCMMIKLEYSNKEISSILSITNNSVFTARYRLKRKLGLPQEQTLDAWIKHIGENYSSSEPLPI